MPTLNWLQPDAAFHSAHAVPYRLLQPVSAHGDGDGRLVFGEACSLGRPRLAAEAITFRQIPYKLAAL